MSALSRLKERTIASQDEAVILVMRELGPLILVSLEGQVDIRDGPETHRDAGYLSATCCVCCA